MDVVGGEKDACGGVTIERLSTSPFPCLTICPLSAYCIRYMHDALLLEEIPGHITRLYSTDVPDDNATLVALACTSRMFSEHALDRIWESAPLWHLAHQMNETLWRIVLLMISSARRPEGTVDSDSNFRRVRCLVSTSGDALLRPIHQTVDVP
jgi:hypothetical protein